MREAFTHFCPLSMDEALADEELFYRLLIERIEPGLAELGAVFLGEWPVSMASLARKKPDEASVAERFEAYVERFPDHQPYDGAFTVDEVIPHCTVVHTDDDAARADAVASVAGLLPIRCDANEIWLVHEVNGRWQRHTPFRLGR